MGRVIEKKTNLTNHKTGCFATVNKTLVMSMVRNVIAEQLNIQKKNVKIFNNQTMAESTFRACKHTAAEAKLVNLGADSLDTVEILMKLEEEFGILFEEKGTEKISTVQEAAVLVDKQLTKT